MDGGLAAASRLVARRSALVFPGLGYLDGALVSADGSSVDVLEMASSRTRPNTTVSVV